MQSQIGTIGNYYAGLHVLKDKDKFYWSIENWDGCDWEEITEELYNSLILFQKQY